MVVGDLQRGDQKVTDLLFFVVRLSFYGCYHGKSPLNGNMLFKCFQLRRLSVSNYGKSKHSNGKISRFKNKEMVVSGSEDAQVGSFLGVVLAGYLEDHPSYTLEN